MQPRRRNRHRRGFTLLEVLVAATIMGIAVGTIFSTLSTSLSTASRVTEHDRAALEAQRILEDLLSDTTLPRGQMLSGHLSAAQTGFEGDWRAQVTPMDADPAGWVVDRVAVQVIWMSGLRPVTLQLDGYRTARLVASAPQAGTAQAVPR